VPNPTAYIHAQITSSLLHFRTFVGQTIYSMFFHLLSHFYSVAGQLATRKARQMIIFFRRLIVIAMAGLTGTIAVGLLAPNATTLILSILALGLGMVLAILFYLLKPLPGVQTIQLPDWPVPTLSSTQPRRIARTSAEVIQITGWRKRKNTAAASEL